MFNSFREYLRKLQNNVLTQEVKGRHVKLTYRSQSYFIFAVSLLNILFGVLFTHIYVGIYEYKLQYSGSGEHRVFLPEGKINFYIQIEDFYQTNLRNSRSISFQQLEGKRVVESSHTSPLDYQDGKVIYPSGLLSNTYPQDTFEVEGLEIDTKDISWNVQGKNIKESGFTRSEIVPPPLWEKYSEVPKLYQDNRYKNWIYNAPFYNFRKLWGSLEVPASGFYSVIIKNRFIHGSKSIVFTETSWIGNKNYFFSIAMIAMGAFGVVSSYFMFLKF